MILFNSLDELERTYEYLAVLGLTKEREVLVILIYLGRPA